MPPVASEVMRFVLRTQSEVCEREDDGQSSRRASRWVYRKVVGRLDDELWLGYAAETWTTQPPTVTYELWSTKGWFHDSVLAPPVSPAVRLWRNICLRVNKRNWRKRNFILLFFFSGALKWNLLCLNVWTFMPASFSRTEPHQSWFSTSERFVRAGASAAIVLRCLGGLGAPWNQLQSCSTSIRACSWKSCDCSDWTSRPDSAYLQKRRLVCWRFLLSLFRCLASLEFSCIFTLTNQRAQSLQDTYGQSVMWLFSHALCCCILVLFANSWTESDWSKQKGGKTAEKRSNV